MKKPQQDAPSRAKEALAELEASYQNKLAQHKAKLKERETALAPALEEKLEQALDDYVRKERERLQQELESQMANENRVLTVKILTDLREKAKTLGIYIRLIAPEELLSMSATFEPSGTAIIRRCGEQKESPPTTPLTVDSRFCGEFAKLICHMGLHNIRLEVYRR